MKSKFLLTTAFLATVLVSGGARASDDCKEKDKSKCPAVQPTQTGGQRGPRSPQSRHRARAARPADATAESGTGSGVSEVVESGEGNEFNINVGNGRVGNNSFDSQTVGLEFSQKIGHHLTLDGEYAKVRESATGALKVDDARIGLTRGLTIRGHELGVGIAVEQNHTIGTDTRIGGLELNAKGPLGTDLISGAYAGNINIDGATGRFKMIRFGAGRDLKIAGREFSIWHWQDRGRSIPTGEPGFLGRDVYYKKTTEIEFPFASLTGGRMKDGSFVYGHEDKKTCLGGECESELQHTFEISHPMGPLIDGVKKGVRALSGH